MANLRTQIHFRAADEKGAKIISEKLGGRETRKVSVSRTQGKTTRSWQAANEPWYGATAIQGLENGHALVTHPGAMGKPRCVRPHPTRFTAPQ